MIRPVRALFISHEADVLPGYLGEAAHRHGITVDVCDLWAGDLLPQPSDHDLIIPLGSAEAAYDDSVPWLAAELAYLREAVAQDVPTFGVCFGAQALARALGGEVRAALHPEVGWYTIDTDAPDIVAPGPWLEWHFDALTPPPGAHVLARSAAGVQAYAFGRHLAVQFHPEVTPAILDDWIAGAHDTLVHHGIDILGFVEETRRRVPQARAAAHQLFDRALDHLQLSQPPDRSRAQERALRHTADG